MSQGRVYIGGKVLQPHEASISVFDRGFLYGDSVYETLRVYSHRPFALDVHLDRLFESGRRIAFELPWTRIQIKDALGKTLEAAALPDARVRIVVTRGLAMGGLEPSASSGSELVVMVMPLPALPDSLYELGLRAATVDVLRNHKLAVDPGAKTGNYINSVMASAEAKARGVDEAIMLDASGRVTEAPTSNVFALIDGRWLTPPLDVGILGGITRAAIFEVAPTTGVDCAEAFLTPEDLRGAQEVFLSSSIRELVAVVELDGRTIANGEPGPRYKQLLDAYRIWVRR